MIRPCAEWRSSRSTPSRAMSVKRQPVEGRTMKRYCTIQDLEPSGDELTSWRRAIHQQPELAFKETATAHMVADKLRAWGFAVAEGVGTTGVVGTLKVGGGTRSIGLRADMDALP